MRAKMMRKYEVVEPNRETDNLLKAGFAPPD